MKALKELINVILMIAILFGVFIGWSWWNVRNLRGFCADIKPGIDVTALPAIAETHHQNVRWLRSSTFDSVKGTWTIYLPATSTFGELACHIEHDKRVVLASGMQ